jgi:hypothetical protein
MPEGKRPLERPELCDSIVVDLRKIRYGGIDWIHVVQDRHQRRALMNMIRSFWFHNMLGSYWVFRRLAVCQGLSSMKLVL